MKRFWRPGNDKPQSRPAAEILDDEDSMGIFNTSGYMSYEKQRENLPIFKHRKSILYLVETHGVTVLIGETGCGKTTQIPQYLMEAGWADKGWMIACTQPRRIAVQTVAARVAEERQGKLGAEVGYTIRFEDVTTPGVTRIKFLTDGVLIREMMADPLLAKYSVIMVDEAHERSLQTDILMGLLKKIQRRRPDLRLIIASATMDATAVAAFYDTSAEKVPEPFFVTNEPFPDRKPGLLSVEGRSFSVRVFYSKEPVSDYVLASVTTTLSIHKLEGPGDVLIFLPGQNEVDAVVDLLSEEAYNFSRKSQGLLVLPLYAGLPRVDQEIVFKPAEQGTRKVVVATNIAETSVTIPGIVFVVDSGFSKQRYYNPDTDVDMLVTVPISKAAANQRTGRAGRVRPGQCYRLYTEDYYVEKMQAESLPEMQRSNLVPTILQLKALGIDNIMRFDWIVSPAPQAMARALETLFSLGILNTDAKLTALGYQLTEFPLDPMLGKMLLSSGELGCSEEALTIAATLSVPSIWVSSRDQQKALDAARNKFAVAEGDHISYLNVFEGFQKAKRPPQWCHQNFINYQAMKKVSDVRNQLSRLSRQIGVKLQSSGGEIQSILKAVTSGCFPHAAVLQPSGDRYKLLRGGEDLYIHPSSVLFRVYPQWIVFQSAMITDKLYMREVAAIEQDWLSEVAPHFFKKRDRP
ncbi:unnamed protein product [Calypogeia fissa]